MRFADDDFANFMDFNIGTSDLTSTPNVLINLETADFLFKRPKIGIFIFNRSKFRLPPSVEM